MHTKKQNKFEELERGEVGERNMKVSVQCGEWGKAQREDD
jgi:hypothetical protein